MTYVSESRLLFQNPAPPSLGEITLAGFLKQSKGVTGLRVFGSYALVYVVEGGGRYQDTHRAAIPISAGDIILIFPEVAHQYGPIPGGEWSELYLVFQGPVFDLWRREGLLDPARPVGRLDDIAVWLSKFEALIEDLKRNEESVLLRACRSQALLAAALTGAGLIADRREEQEPLWLTHAQRSLQQDLETTKDTRRVAREVGLSADVFRKRFTERTGLSPSRYRMARRIEAACQLLTKTDMTQRQIAENLGFGDEFIFSRRFTQIQGVSPSRFRAAQRGRS